MGPHPRPLPCRPCHLPTELAGSGLLGAKPCFEGALKVLLGADISGSFFRGQEEWCLGKSLSGICPWDHDSSSGALLIGSQGSWLWALHGLCFMGCFPGVVTVTTKSTHGEPAVPGGHRHEHPHAFTPKTERKIPAPNLLQEVTRVETKR